MQVKYSAQCYQSTSLKNSLTQQQFVHLYLKISIDLIELCGLFIFFMVQVYTVHVNSRYCMQLHSKYSLNLPQLVIWWPTIAIK